MRRCAARLCGAIYHVKSRGDRLDAIYRDDADRQAHLALIALTCKEGPLREAARQLRVGVLP